MTASHVPARAGVGPGTRTGTRRRFLQSFNTAGRYRRVRPLRGLGYLRKGIRLVRSETQHFSNTVATPMPPPMQRVARPFLASGRLAISWIRVTMMRAPEAPTG